MARANRLGGQGGIFHVTHPGATSGSFCSNLRWPHRDGYCARLRDRLQEAPVPDGAKTGSKNRA
jgi:hypothetical protein